MNALADPKLGEFINENFVSAFQKVGTFKIVGKQKQGGNVASYFCAQDGRVLHVVAGPVNAATLLKEAKWVVDTVKKSLAENKSNGTSFKSQFRKAHAQRLRTEHGMMVEAVTVDAPTTGAKGALTYRDPTGKTLAPKLPAPPIQGPDVSFDDEQLAQFTARQDAAMEEASELSKVRNVRYAGGGLGAGGGGRGCRKCYVLGNQGRVHQMLAAHSMKKIETVYGSIFEGILGERVSTQPVIVNNPFPWHRGRTPNGQVLEGRSR